MSDYQTTGQGKVIIDSETSTIELKKDTNIIGTLSVNGTPLSSSPSAGQVKRVLTYSFSGTQIGSPGVPPVVGDEFFSQSVTSSGTIEVVAEVHGDFYLTGGSGADAMRVSVSVGPSGGPYSDGPVAMCQFNGRSSGTRSHVNAKQFATLTGNYEVALKMSQSGNDDVVYSDKIILVITELYT